MEASTPSVTGPAPCWRTIGVWGRQEPRCPELDRVVHCRNCDVFRAAGRELFDAAPPAGYGDDWAEVAADHPVPPGTTEPALAVRVGTELLALPLAIVRQVHAWRPVCRVPHRQSAVLLGLVNIDGELRLCASLEALGGNPPRSPADEPPKGRMIAIGRGEATWVVPVDEALGLPLVAIDTLEEVPVTVVRSDHGFLRGVFTYRDRRVGLVDGDLLLALLERSVA